MKKMDHYKRSFLILFRLGATLSVIAVSLLVGGCNNGEMKQPSNPSVDGGSKNDSGVQGGIKSGTSGDATTSTSLSATSSFTETTLYFSNKNADKLIAQKRKVAKTPKIASQTINELIKGPDTDDLVATIPAGTKLLGLEIKNGIATVNFSNEIKEEHTGGSAGEIMTVYSIVNTLTEFPTVKSVQILVDGDVVDTLAGHLDLTTAIPRDKTIIQN